MSDFVLSGIATLDASGLVEGAGKSEAALNEVAEAEKRADDAGEKADANKRRRKSSDKALTDGILSAVAALKQLTDASTLAAAAQSQTTVATNAARAAAEGAALAFGKSGAAAETFGQAAISAAAANRVLDQSSRDVQTIVTAAATAQESAATAAKDASEAATAAAASNDRAAEAGRRASIAADALGIANQRVTAAARALAEAEVALAASQENDAAAKRKVEAAALALAAAQLGANKAALAYETTQKKAKSTAEELTGVSNRQTYAIRNVGQQFGDLGLSITSGISPAQAFSQQAGQIGYALSEMEGRLGKVGAFLTGPWGIALTIASAVVAKLIDKFIESGDAADKLKDKTLSLEDAFRKQSIGTDAARKAIEDYNQSARKAIESGSIATDRAIKLAEARLKEAAATIASTKARLAQQQSVDQERQRNPAFGDRGDIAGLAGAQSGAAFAIKAQIKAAEDADKAISTALGNLYVKRGKGVAAAAVDPLKAINDQFDRMRDKAIRAAQGNLQFSRSIDTTLTKIEQQRKAALDSQKDRDKANRGGSGGAAGDAAAAAKLAAADTGVARAQAELTIARRKANAELKAGTITQDQATAQIAQAERALNGAKDAAKAHAGALRDAASASREAEAADRKLETMAEQIRVRFGEADSAAGRYLKTLREITELTSAGKFAPEEGALYTLRATVQENERRNPNSLKTSFDPEAVRRDIKAIEEHAEAEREAARIARENARDIKGAFNTVGEAVGRAFGQKAGSTVSGIGSIADTIINGKSKEAQKKSQDLADSIGKIAKGVGISTAGAEKIGKFAGKGIEGAATGAFANSIFEPLAKGLGIKTSKTGAQIGGAIGSALPIPGGDIIGSIIGSVVGGLFKKTKSGGATISADGSISTSGNSNAQKAAASQAANSIVSGIQQIAQQLGGTVGQLSPITIGTYGKNKEYRVNTTGGTTLGGSKNAIAGVEYFASGDEGAAAALAFAIKLQVQRGAIDGLSDAVRRALQNSDLDKGIADALKVKQLESLIGGAAGALKDTFKQFETGARDSVRVAKAYGLDLVATERVLGEQRAKLAADTIKASVGGLSDFLNGLKTSEGSPADIRQSILDQVGLYRDQALSGDQEAIDRITQLLPQLLQTSRDAFGTGGGQYASDRTLATTLAQQIVQAETNRVNEAAKAAQGTTAAVATVAAGVNESNDLLAVQNDILREISNALTLSPVTAVDTSSTIRVTKLG